MALKQKEVKWIFGNGVRERLQIVVSVTRQWTVASERLRTAKCDVYSKSRCHPSHQSSQCCSRKKTVLLLVLTLRSFHKVALYEIVLWGKYQIDKKKTKNTLMPKGVEATQSTRTSRGHNELINWCKITTCIHPPLSTTVHLTVWIIKMTADCFLLQSFLQTCEAHKHSFTIPTCNRFNLGTSLNHFEIWNIFFDPIRIPLMRAPRLDTDTVICE